MRKRMLGILLTLCIMIMYIVPLTALAASPASETADFTASDGGAEAIALLNSVKTGSADSTWDNSTKTLTLKGIYFATTAPTAVKLPDGATVILADGTENHIIGGSTTAAQDGEYNNKIFVYGIYAAGVLTVQGETKGTGKLFVTPASITTAAMLGHIRSAFMQTVILLSKAAL